MSEEAQEIVTPSAEEVVKKPVVSEDNGAEVISSKRPLDTEESNEVGDSNEENSNSNLNNSASKRTKVENGEDESNQSAGVGEEEVDDEEDDGEDDGEDYGDEDDEEDGAEGEEDDDEDA